MLSLVVGGPWYHSKIDSRTGLTLVALGVSAPAVGAKVLSFMQEDCLLDVSRNRLLERAIGKGAHWFLSLDADCSIQDVYPLFRALYDAHRADVALVGFPALEGSGRWNVVTLEEQRPTEIAPEQFEVSRIGFGCVAFRLGWYAKNWPRARPYFQTVPIRDAHGKWGAVTEDFGHCLAVRELGGKVLADGRVKVGHHMGRAGSVDHEAAQP